MTPKLRNGYLNVKKENFTTRSDNTNDISNKDRQLVTTTASTMASITYYGKGKNSDPIRNDILALASEEE